MTSKVNIGYAFEHLRRALAHAERSDTDVRAAARVEAWFQTINGMLSGELDVGSRTPVVDTPAWVTLEVLHGGFASGNYPADGALRDWERSVLAQLPGEATSGSDRERLNLWYLSDGGQAALLRAHSNSRVKIDLPEEGALLCVALLIENDRYGAARAVIEEIVPWFDRLRFYPELTAVSRASGALVHRMTAHQIAHELAKRQPKSQVMAMGQTLRVWNPLYDRLVQLWHDADTIPPEDWRERQDAIRRDVETAARSGVPRRFRDPKGPFRQLLEAEDPTAAAMPLARAIRRWGAPGSEQRSAVRALQAHAAEQPLHADIAHVVADRMERVPAGQGIASADDACAPIEAGESELVPEGATVPEYLVDKTRLAVEAPVADLVRTGVIGSGEVLAEVVPQLTAAVASSGIADSEVRALYAALYAAFRGRRSLLLLNYEHQVRFEELPWVSALAPFRADELGAAVQASEVLRDVLRLYIQAFPQTQLPNPLVTELHALAQTAKLDIPLVEELAADIFMGGFTPKFARAAQITAEWMDGTIYARYFDLGADRTDDFAQRCEQRAEEGKLDGHWVAHNGAIIEQASILTSHNLAPVCRAIDLRDDLIRLAPDIVPRIAEWMTSELGKPTADQARLRAIKNAAYAWRQLVFFVSFVPDELREAAVEAVQTRFAQNVDVARHLESTVNGLRLIVAGGEFSHDGTAIHAGAAARRLLGWSSVRDFK